MSFATGWVKAQVMLKALLPVYELVLSGVGFGLF
jgi:hypothetical protein